MASNILCCGEALIDFVPVPVPASEGGMSYRPCLGGSVYNVARALGRLDVQTRFVGGISEDFFGDMLVDGLVESGVGVDLVERSPSPSTFGFVSLDEDEPAYAFYDTAAAERLWTNAPGADALRDVNCLHFGSISLIREPAASAFEALAAREAATDRVITFDPNIRPSLIKDVDAYRDRMARMMALADVVKISVADLDWLHPGLDPQDAASHWLAGGTSLVAITHGERGALGCTAQASVFVEAVPIALVDTVGAGDSFMGGFLAALSDSLSLSPSGLADLTRTDLEACLHFAQRVAGSTCQRRGADAPRRSALARS